MEKARYAETFLLGKLGLGWYDCYLPGGAGGMRRAPAYRQFHGGADLSPDQHPYGATSHAHSHSCARDDSDICLPGSLGWIRESLLRQRDAVLFQLTAAWTETSCQRFTGNDGQQTLFIGNLFSVSIMPRSGQSIQQWVNTQTNQYETVTLGALTDTQAQAAATVSAAPSAITDPNKPFDAEPFWSTFAIVAGSHSIYMVNGFIAQMSMTDTIPNLSRQQLAQQVVSTFIVP